MSEILTASLIFILFPFYGYGQLYELPDTPEPGVCYLTILAPPEFISHTEVYPVYNGIEIDKDKLDTIELIIKPKRVKYEYQDDLRGWESNDRSKRVVCMVEIPEEKKVLVIVKDLSDSLYYENQSIRILEKVSERYHFYEAIPCEMLSFSQMIEIKYAPFTIELSKENEANIWNEIGWHFEEYPRVPVHIIVHTESINDPEEAIELSDQRFEKIKEFLISLGINEYLIGGYGLGQEKGVGSGFQFRAYQGF